MSSVYGKVWKAAYKKHRGRKRERENERKKERDVRAKTRAARVYSLARPSDFFAYLRLAPDHHVLALLDAHLGDHSQTVDQPALFSNGIGQWAEE